MKRWRRTLLLAALLLLAGAVMNVAVAWGIAATARQVNGTEWGYTHVSSHTGPDSAGRGQLFDTLICGWPLSSLGCTTYDTDYVILVDEPLLPRVRQPIGRSKQGARPKGARFGAGVSVEGWTATSEWFAASNGRLPIRPLLPGFLINTIFYAFVVGAILALPLSFFPLRRRLRARRGRCPKCNYDLAGIDGACPECGADQ